MAEAAVWARSHRWTSSRRCCRRGRHLETHREHIVVSANLPGRRVIGIATVPGRRNRHKSGELLAQTFGQSAFEPRQGMEPC